jgi:hypothetical protein
MEASVAIESRLIGAIFVEKNLITDEQLEEALQLQEATGDRLGEIVVAKFGVGRLELAGVLAEQWATYEQVDRTSAAFDDHPDLLVAPTASEGEQARQPLGEISIQHGFITSEQLDAALDAQRENGGRIGEILVEQGSLTRLDLASALAEQWSALQKLRPPAAVAEPQPWQNGSPLATPPAAPVVTEDSAVADLDERLRALEQAGQTTPWREELDRVASELREQVGAVAARLEAGTPGSADHELTAALEAVGARIDQLENASAAGERAEGDLIPRIDDLSARIEDVAKATPGVESDALRARIASLEDGDRTADEELERLAAQLGALESSTQERLDAFSSRQPDPTSVDELRVRLDELAEAVARRPDDAPFEELRTRLNQLSEATQRLSDDSTVVDLNARVDELAARPTIDAGLEERVDGVAARLEGIEAAAGALSELRSSLEGLNLTRGDEALAIGARFAGLEAGLDALGERISELAATDLGRAAASETLASGQAALEERLNTLLEQRLDELAGRFTDEVATVRAEVGSLGARIDALDRHNRDTQTATTAVEHLAARVEALVGLRARDAEAAQVVAADLGARLERLEESVASEGAVGLKKAIAKLERRLEKQAAIGEEQARVTERALRKGLKSLGARLTDTESEYIAAGKAMSRSIERLGAVVVEADARIAHQIPVSETEGYVAFAPTKVGYRLVDLAGRAPKVGTTIEIDGVDGKLRVTGYGRSPLPLDSRACAYLDRA